MKYFLKNFTFYGAIVVSVGLAVFGGWLTYVQSSEYAMGNIFYYILGILLCWYMSLQFHECGHKLFGLFVGMDVQLKPTKFFSTSIGCSMAPKYAGGSMRKRFIVTASGGLTVNFLLLGAGTVFMCIPVSSFGSYYVLNVIFRGFLPTSLYIFIINVVPFMYKDGRTDGLAIYEAVKRDDCFRVAEVVLTAQGMMNSGLSIRDVGESTLMNAPQIQEDDPYFIILTQLRCKYYEAVGNRQKEEFYKKRFEDLQQYL